MKYAGFGFVVLLVLVVFIGTRTTGLVSGLTPRLTTEQTKELRSTSAVWDTVDSLQQSDLRTPLFDEYLRGKFDQCTP